MDDANRIEAEVACPRCGHEAEAEIRIRYGPVGHPPLAVGDRIEWSVDRERLGGPADAPSVAVAAQASCGECANTATAFGKRSFKALRAACERVVDDGAKPGRKRNVTLAHLLAQLDYQYRLKAPRELGGEPISSPGRLIERTAELVLGYSPTTFEHVAVRVRIERDRVEAVEPLPVALQDALKAFPAAMYFGSFAAGHAAVLGVLDDHAPEALADAVVRAALALELSQWRAVLGDDVEGRLEFADKLRHLLGQLAWVPSGVQALARIDRFTTGTELGAIFAEAFGDATDGDDEPAAALARCLAR